VRLERAIVWRGPGISSALFVSDKQLHERTRFRRIMGDRNSRFPEIKEL
jgi:hypothetical protein